MFSILDSFDVANMGHPALMISGIGQVAHVNTAALRPTSTWLVCAPMWICSRDLLNIL